MADIIAVHVGAGFHAKTSRSEYKSVMRKACKKAMSVLKTGGSEIDAVVMATKTLEDSFITNAGKGSSLTRVGSVECDASVMEGKTLNHGAVGAVPGVPNPVILAQKIMEAHEKAVPGGLVPPSLITGTGARDWAILHDIEVCKEEELITNKAYQSHISTKLKLERIAKTLDVGNSKRKMDEVNEVESDIQKKIKTDENQTEKNSHLLDTVGAICMSASGDTASAVSSGGLLFKYPGRVGQAALYGAGCWAQNNVVPGVNVCVSTSGCGEQLIRTNFARLCAESVSSPSSSQPQTLISNVEEKFLKSPFLSGETGRHAGAILLLHDKEDQTCDLYWLHTTATFGFAFMSGSQPKPTTCFSEMTRDKIGKVVQLGCKSYFVEQNEHRLDGECVKVEGNVIDANSGNFMNEGSCCDNLGVDSNSEQIVHNDRSSEDLVNEDLFSNELGDSDLIDNNCRSSLDKINDMTITICESGSNNISTS